MYSKSGITLYLALLSMVAGAVAAPDLEEVVVTAQKRPEPMREVPISVATLTSEQLAYMFAGGEDILGLAARVPGLYAESSNGRGAPRFYIRGLGNVDFDLAASQPVSVVMDDLVMENVILKSFPLFDVNRAEVIRGPQGTLFGRNTTAGIVKFATEQPGFEQDGYLNIMGGQLDGWKAEGAVGGTVVDGSFAVRASFLSNNRGNWVGNGISGQDDTMGHYEDNAYRLQGLLKINDNWSALLGFQERSLDGSSSFFRANVFTTGKSGLNAFYDRGWVFYDEGDGNPQSIDINTVSLRVGFDDDDIAFTSITALQEGEYASKGDIDGGFAGGPGFIPFQAVTEDRADIRQFTQELRVNGSEGLLDWHLGAYYFDSELDVTTIDGFYGLTTVRHSNTSWAVYAQLGYHLTDRLTLAAGLRHTDDKRDLTVGEQNVDSFALSIGAATIQDYDPVAVSDSQQSWDVSANYRMTENTSLFARIAEGFRAQSIQGRDIAFEGLPSVADSEDIISYEAGYKADWFENRARFNLAVFYYKVDDLQLSAIGGANNGNSLLNADRGNGKGAEMDLEWALTDRLSIWAGVGWVNTEIRDRGLETATCGSGACTVTNPTRENALGTTVASINGNPFQAAPEMTANISLHYSHPWRSGEIYFHTDWAFQGDTQMALYDAVEFETSSQFEGGVRLAYINSERTLEAALFGRNITDEDNIKGFIDFNNNTDSLTSHVSGDLRSSTASSDTAVNCSRDSDRGA